MSAGVTTTLSLLEDRQRTREVPRVADAPSRLSRYQHLAMLECEAEFLPFESFDDVTLEVRLEASERSVEELRARMREVELERAAQAAAGNVETMKQLADAFCPDQTV